MYWSEISIWGSLLTLFLLALSMLAVWLVDGRTLRKMLKLHLHLPRLSGKPLLSVLISMLTSSFALSACLMLSLPCRAFWPVVVMLFVLLWLSTPSAMSFYLRSMKHSEPHRLYLLANGATHLESVMPSVRRALRVAILPLLCQRSSLMPLAMLTLACGLLMSGTTVGTALVAIILIWAAALAAAVLALLFAIWLTDRLSASKHATTEK
ncbi:MAG: ABC transporter permease [Prevotella sp.]|nr:ABC transporter permease [Prevotella sp.]